MSLAKPKAVFFDWDGTLVDSFDLLYRAHNYTRGQLGLGPFSVEAFTGYFGQPREKLYAEIYGVDNIETAKGHFESYVLENHVKGLKPMEGAAELLETLDKLQIPCGVVTNKKHTLVQAEIQNYGWQDYFISVVGAGEAEADKPSAKPLELAHERSGLGFAMSDLWLVGDTDNDLACANAAGCPAILIADGAEAADLLAKYDVALHQDNCLELSRFLLQYAD